MQLLDNIRKRPCIQFPDACTEAPVASAIYFVFVKSCLIYIGRSSNLRMRLASHEKRSDWVNEKAVVRWALVPRFSLERLEKRLIFKLRPYDNRRLKNKSHFS